MVDIDLSMANLFHNDNVKFKKRAVFIYGHNGTGKSTLTKLIKKQLQNEYNVSIFQGFDNLIDKDEQLEAVILGKENVEINKQIKQLEGQRAKIENNAKIIRKQVEPPDDGSHNLFTEWKTADELFNKQDEKINRLFSQGASSIKNNPQSIINLPKYNKNQFKNDIEDAKLLTEKEIKECQEILKSEVKEASPIIFPKSNFKQINSEVIKLLKRTVKAKIALPRIEQNRDKIEFARYGLGIHKKGDICAFCGNAISDNTFKELEEFFTADDIKKFQAEIEIEADRLREIRKNIESLNINDDDFYQDYRQDVTTLSLKLQKRKSECFSWLDELLKLLADKIKNMFNPIDDEKFHVPDNLTDIACQYEKLQIDNNSTDLRQKRFEAENAVRKHYVKKFLDNSDYYNEIKEKNKYKMEVAKVNDKLQEKNKELDNLIHQIDKLNGTISSLLDKTVSETILANNINNKLKNMAPFKLVYIENDKSKGNYNIKDLRTNRIRKVNTLSTGEKNIVAFLYFLEKLNEVNKNIDNRSKILIFDDPMNSNDDTIQYLIIEELQKILRDNDYEHVIIMTHNRHFYLNVKYNIKASEFYRLNSDGMKTYITTISPKEDFKTSYEQLWMELIFLHKESTGCGADMLLNPIRRIIETYTKFNNIDVPTFCQKVTGAQKLLNVNSHSIDDLEADLNTMTKNEIIQLMYDCFKKNHAEAHFMQNWPDLQIDNNGKIIW